RFNRVGGVDAKLKLGANWVITAQALASSTQLMDGTYKAGPAYSVYAERSARNLEYNVLYLDAAPGFQTNTGFYFRPDIRRVSQFAQYRFRREGKIFQWHGPGAIVINDWDHKGTRLDWA